MMNAVAYIRVSTDAQAGDDRYGIDAQKQQINEFCSANDIQVSQWFVDGGESGVKASRPQLDAILYGDLTNPPVEAVVIAKNDRIAREIKLYFYYKQLLYQKGIKLISVSEDFGELGAFSGFLEAFVMFVAEQERMNISKRTSSGRKIKAAAGGYSGGKPPYGYSVSDGALLIAPDEARIVAEIFRCKAEGMTLEQISEKLGEDGYLTRAGKPFSFSTVRYILNNRRLYEGMYKYGDETDWVKGQHEPIL